jgi:acetyl esterase/lipase
MSPLRRPPSAFRLPPFALLSRLPSFAFATAILIALAAAPFLPAQTAAEVAAAAAVDAAAADAAAHIKPDRIVPYKQVGGHTLSLSVFNPPGHRPDRPVAGIVFFHGGGFNIGAPSNFYAQTKHIAQRGLVAISVEYRIRSRHQTTQREAIQDAFSALRWVRARVTELGIDPKRLAVAGGSAGGFLAAAVTTLRDLDEPGEDTSVSPRPNALILFNSMIDRGPGSRAFAKVEAAMGEKWKTISPLHNLYPDFPPTVHFLGTADKNISVASARKMKAEIEKVGGRCDLHLYEGQDHGFFNYGRGDNSHYRLTLLEADRFLVSLGFLAGPTPDKPVVDR